MRPIFFEEDDEKLMNNSTTYLWGKDFLITPILKDSVKSTVIYFPKTANWFNFYSDKKVEGGQTKTVEVQENSIPTYVRSGAFILMANAMQTTDNYNSNSLDLHYYHDNSIKESERTFYNDDGLTANAFEKGNYEILGFEAELTKRCLEIDFEAEFGENWNPTKKEINLVIHNVNWNPKIIKVDGKRLKISPINKQLIIPVKWNVKKLLKVKITLK
jgi:alpha-glucosidase (family GH31 glycosyl hydrolase)